MAIGEPKLFSQFLSATYVVLSSNTSSMSKSLNSSTGASGFTKELVRRTARISVLFCAQSIICCNFSARVCIFLVYLWRIIPFISKEARLTAVGFAKVSERLTLKIYEKFLFTGQEHLLISMQKMGVILLSFY
ncbi:hypothetical protein D3C86_1189520 [compost metagenome]